MLQGKFENINSDDILRLLDEKTPERKTLEYKATLNIDGDSRAEFLADISSFANASGGDIIFGISDQRGPDGNATGTPESIQRLTITNPDTVIGKVSQVIRDGVQPRIPGVEVKVIDIPGHGEIILIRVPKSWHSPHMVSLGGRSKFWSRSLSGKMQLDVQQIGAAFAAQRGIGERLRAWKADRISKLVSGEGPIQMRTPSMLFHFIAASALNNEQSMPRIFAPSSLRGLDRLMSLSPETSRYNADGLLYVSSKTKSGESYLQIFRDGHLEYGDSYFLGESDTEFPGFWLETKVRETFAVACNLLKEIEVEEPVFVSLTLIGMKGLVMLAHQEIRWQMDRRDFDRPVILSPDVLIQDRNEGPPDPMVLLPLADAIWQGAGFPETPHKQMLWQVPLHK